MFDEFGERELSEVIVESVKKLARLLALVIVCLYTMKAGATYMAPARAGNRNLLSRLLYFTVSSNPG